VEPYQDIRRHDRGAVRHLELHRPEALNAWTPDMGRELLHALDEAAHDPEVRSILITGAGRAFCAGADVKNARDLLAGGEPDLSSRLRTIYNPIVLAVRHAPKPVVGAVQGAVAGLGASLALACDLLVASSDAYVLLAFARIGVMPDGGALSFLAERVGLPRAAELAMLAERLPAERAREWGIVNAVHPPEELGDAAFALADRLAAGPTVALASIKRTLVSAVQPRLAGQLELEAERQQVHGATLDYAEGRAAFLEKRPVRFVGR
jgi:2-(1,2-epoxy-1,2-dihydrophenyl)acetyl-CoA isomerase